MGMYWKILVKHPVTKFNGNPFSSSVCSELLHAGRLTEGHADTTKLTGIFL
jgi:hypothetical protein